MKRWTIVVLALLITIIALVSIFLLRSSTKLDALAEEAEELRKTLAEVGVTEVPDIDKPGNYYRETVDLIERTLQKLAQAQERHKERTGEFESDYYKLDVDIPPDLQVILMIPEPTALCIEMGSTTVPGAKRRFISVTGEIDAGTCQPGRPLAEQVGDDPAARGGGHMEYSDVRLRDDGIPKTSAPIGRQWTLVFDAEWVGSSLPIGQECDIKLFSDKDDPIGGHVWTFKVYETALNDFEGPAFFQRSDLGRERPARVELNCTNAF